MINTSGDGQSRKSLTLDAVLYIARIVSSLWMLGVLGPFKSKLRVAQNDWMVSNPGITLNIHNLAAFLKLKKKKKKSKEMLG